MCTFALCSILKKKILQFLFSPRHSNAAGTRQRIVGSKRVHLKFATSKYALINSAYIHKTYFDWIENYASRVNLHEHYGLPYDKAILAEKLDKLIKEIKEKMARSPLVVLWPINKNVIGKNAHKIIKGIISEPEYTI